MYNFDHQWGLVMQGGKSGETKKEPNTNELYRMHYLLRRGVSV